MSNDFKSPGAKGAHGEMVACAWLLARGYDVFRNVSPHGPVDLIAMKGGKTEYFEVKHAKYAGDGSITFPRVPVDRKSIDLQFLCVFDDGHCELAPTGRFKDDMRRKPCRTCGKRFDAGYYGKRIYCSEPCKPNVQKLKKEAERAGTGDLNL